MSKEINKCDWCKGKTNMPSSFVAMSPIQPKMEKKIHEAIDKYGNEWWIELEKKDKKLFEELSLYDQLTCTVGRGFVCAKCLDKDATNYKNYRHEESIK